MSSGMILPTVLLTEDDIVDVDLEMPRFYVDRMNGNVTCSQCGRLGQAMNEVTAGFFIRNHAMAHIQKLTPERFREATGGAELL